MQLLLNINDQSKAILLMEFLKVLNYISSIKELKTNEIPEADENIVRERMCKSMESDLLDWDTIKNEFDGI